MKSFKKFLSVLACALLLAGAGCSSPSSEQRQANATPCRAAQMTARTVDIQSVTLMNPLLEVANVSGGEKTQALGEPNVGNGGFRAALENSLEANGVSDSFSENAKYSVSARIVRTEIRTMSVRYLVVDKATGEVFFDRTLTSTNNKIDRGNEAGYSNAYIQVSKEQMARRNIENFISELDRAFLQKEKAQAAKPQN